MASRVLPADSAAAANEAATPRATAEAFHYDPRLHDHLPHVNITPVDFDAAETAEDGAHQPRRRRRRRQPATAVPSPGQPTNLHEQFDELMNIEVLPPKLIPNMGTFGTYLSFYRKAHDIEAHDQACETDLEELRAGGYHARTHTTYEDHNTRRLIVNLQVPDAFNNAVYMNQAAAASTSQTNYVFAQQLRLLRAPITGKVHITLDDAVCAGLERAGYTLCPFDEVRNIAEMEQCVAESERLMAQVEAEAEIGDDAQDGIDQLLGAIEDDDVDDEISVPPSLSPTFRATIMGTGSLAVFRVKLYAAIEERVTWDDIDYAPLREWPVQGSRVHWKQSGASDPEVDRWDQAVLEMRQVYCLLRKHERGDAVWDVNGVPADVESARASFTTVRKAAKRWAADEAKAGRALTAEGYFTLCRSLSDSVYR